MFDLENVIATYFNIENLRHAYLLETNDINKVLIIAERIFTKFNTEVENLEKMLDNNSYSDLKIIRPDGQWIKKEQIEVLKSDFKTKSTFNNKRIYIIANAENLNTSSANTMLKFLEEPEEDIIALLVTQNKTKVIETIVSRCQYILLDSNKEKKELYNGDSLRIFEILEKKKQFSNFEIVKEIEKYEDRNQIKNLFKEIINIYEQILLKKIGINVCFNYSLQFDKINENNTIESIKKKVKALIDATDALEYNVNLRLLVDKLVILMFGVD